MRTSIGLRTAALVVGILAASCSVKGQRSDIVVSAVLSVTATAAVPPATAPTCNCPTPSGTSGGEANFLKVGRDGLVPCFQVENRLTSNAVTGIRLNTND